MSKQIRPLFRAALLVAVGVSTLNPLSDRAVAQEAEAEAEADSGASLETITVTATKREQTLQETPVAVSVVGADAIEKAEIQDLLDLQSLVPSLRVSQLNSTANTSFFIRGFGNGSNNVGIEPSVGVFVDGVYRSRSFATIVDLPNLERVEVLRGPQSTLFGKNASAGVVSIVTRAPQFEFSGSGSVTAGNFATGRVHGDVTGPVTDKVAFSLSGNYNTRDGYADDLATGSDLNNRNRWGVRGQLLYEPDDSLSLRFIGDFDEIDERCCLAPNIVAGPVTTGVVAALGQIVIEDPFSYTGFANFDPVNEIENSGVSLHADRDFGDFSLTSITAYRTVETLALADADSSSADLSTSLNDGSIKTFTQEVRLASEYNDSPLDWMIGGFYFDETLETSGEFTYGAQFRTFADVLAGGTLAGTEALLGLPAGTIGGDGRGVFETRGQDNRAWSVFGTVDWHVDDRLTATAGLNYSDDKKEAFLNQVNTDVFSGLDLVEEGVNRLGLTPAQAVDPATNPLLALRSLQFLPPFLNFPNVVEDGKSHDDQLTYTFRLAYDLTDDINVYGSYATGFKATSWNLSRDSRPFPADFVPGSSVTNPASSPIRDAGLAVNNLTTGTRFAGPEDSEVIEIGVKGQFDRIAFSLTLFDQTIEGFQSNIFTGLGFALANAGEQSTLGLEFDTTWAVTDELLLSFAGTFLDPEFDSFPNSPSGDLTGRRPAGISQVSTSTAVQYSTTVDGFDAYVRADWEYSSDADYFDSDVNQALIGFQRSYHLVNASAGFGTPNDFEVTVWSRNLLDEEYITSAFPSIAQSGSISGYPNQPRTFGVTFRKRF